MAISKRIESMFAALGSQGRNLIGIVRRLVRGDISTQIGRHLYDAGAPDWAVV